MKKIVLICLINTLLGCGLIVDSSPKTGSTVGISFIDLCSDSVSEGLILMPGVNYRLKINTYCPPDNIEWYVNDVLVDDSGSETFDFNETEPGEYKIKVEHYTDDPYFLINTNFVCKGELNVTVSDRYEFVNSLAITSIEDDYNCGQIKVNGSNILAYNCNGDSLYLSKDGGESFDKIDKSNNTIGYYFLLEDSTNPIIYTAEDSDNLFRITDDVNKELLFTPENENIYSNNLKVIGNHIYFHSYFDMLSFSLYSIDCSDLSSSSIIKRTIAKELYYDQYTFDINYNPLYINCEDKSVTTIYSDSRAETADDLGFYEFPENSELLKISSDLSVISNDSVTYIHDKYGWQKVEYFNNVEDYYIKYANSDFVTYVSSRQDWVEQDKYLMYKDLVNSEEETIFIGPHSMFNIFVNDEYLILFDSDFSEDYDYLYVYKLK